MQYRSASGSRGATPACHSTRDFSLFMTFNSLQTLLWLAFYYCYLLHPGVGYLDYFYSRWYLNLAVILFEPSLLINPSQLPHRFLGTWCHLRPLILVGLT